MKFRTYARSHFIHKRLKIFRSNVVGIVTVWGPHTSIQLTVKCQRSRLGLAWSAWVRVPSSYNAQLLCMQ